MDIVLDSNIFRKDWELPSKVHFSTLIDYLKRTESCFVIPQVIFDEVKALNKRHLLDHLDKINVNIDNFNKGLINPSYLIKKTEIDIEAISEEYIKYIIEKMKKKRLITLPYDGNLLEEITKRAANRVKPCDANGFGFRDTLIWLSIKQYTVQSFTKQIVFISENVTDFGDTSKKKEELTRLHPDLEQECIDKGIKINYFTSIKEFIETHSIKIGFLTLEYVKSKISNEQMIELVEKYINIIDLSFFSYSYNIRSNKEIKNIIQIYDISIGDLENLSFYEMLDNGFVVSFDVNIDVDLEVEYIKTKGYNSFEYEFLERYSELTQVKLLRFETLFSFSFFLKSDVITELEINDFVHM